MSWNGSDISPDKNGAYAKVRSRRTPVDATSSSRHLKDGKKPLSPSPSSLHLFRLFLILLLLGAAVALLHYLFFRTPASPHSRTSAPPNSHSSALPDVTPAAAPTNRVETPPPAPEKPKRVTAKGTPIPDGVEKDERGIWRYPGGQRWVDVATLKFPPKKESRKLFKHSSENRIAAMLQMDPARMLPFLAGRRKAFDQSFADDFKASLNDPIEPDEKDTPEEAALRQAVIETKADLKARMDAGEDVVQIMNDTQKELDRLCQYQSDLKKLVQKAINNPEYSDQDAQDCLDAANEMLERNGMSKMTMPGLHMRQTRLKIQAERRARLDAQKSKAQ